MTIRVVDDIYKLKYFILILLIKKHKENTGNFVLMGAWQPYNVREQQI